MQAKEGVITLLNRVVTHKLTAINQYFVQAKMCDNWGYGKLHHWLREVSIQDMKDAEELVERILALDGVPNLQRLGTVQIGEAPIEDLRLALQSEQTAVGLLSEGIAHCLQVTDYTTHTLLEEMLKSAEERIDWLETQLTTVEQIGLQLYLSRQL